MGSVPIFPIFPLFSQSFDIRDSEIQGHFPVFRDSGTLPCFYAREIWEVSPFIPVAQGSGVLVTSAYDVAGEGGHHPVAH